MKLEITERQLKTIANSLKKETDIDEQDEPVSAEPKPGTSDKQSGGKGYPESTTKWAEVVGGPERGPANQIANTVWHKTGSGSKVTRGVANQLQECVFNGHITTNGRFLILQDNVFDIQEQKDLGNLWDSIDTFKLIFKGTDSELEGYKEIQEKILSLPILENSDNLYVMRDFILEWDFFDWGRKELSDAGAGIKDFVTTSWEGAKKLGVTVSKGEWAEVLNLLKKGVIYVIRKLRDALYTNVGMVVDAILIATGIGKVAQFVMWALVVSLDVYELSSGDYPPETIDDPMWMKLMFLGFDVMGMVVAGAAVKTLRAMFAPLFAWVRKGGSAAKWFARNPKAKVAVQQMSNAVDKAPSYLKRASQYLSRKFPKGANFINSIMKSVGNFLSKLKNSLTSLINSSNKVVKGAVAGGMVAGLGYGIDKVVGGNETQLSTVQQQNLDLLMSMPEI